MKIHYVILAIIALIIANFKVYDLGYNSGATAEALKYEELINDYNIKQQELENERARELHRVSTEYQENLKNSEANASTIISKLSNTSNKLRIKVKQLEAKANDPDTSGCFVDGRAELDPKTARDLIRITNDGDAWIKALQDSLKAYQQGEK